MRNHSINERDVEAYLVKKVKALGGEVRKVEWVGRQGAPDRLVMLPAVFGRFDGDGLPARTLWVEVKNPRTVLDFPGNAHERKQAREHKRMRAMGQRVVVVGTFQQVDELLG